jgi:hypothetical protein
LPINSFPFVIFNEFGKYHEIYAFQNCDVSFLNN